MFVDPQKSIDAIFDGSRKRPLRSQPVLDADHDGVDLLRHGGSPAGVVRGRAESEPPTMEVQDDGVPAGLVPVLGGSCRATTDILLETMSAHLIFDRVIVVLKSAAVNFRSIATFGIVLRSLGTSSPREIA